MMLTNNEVCEAIGIKPKYRVKISDYIFVAESHEELKQIIKSNYKDWFPSTQDILKQAIELYPDSLSRTPNASFNRELLEECILKVKPTLKIDFYEDGGANPSFYKLVAWVSRDKLFKSAKKTRGEALLWLAMAIKDEIKEEVSKVTEFIY